MPRVIDYVQVLEQLTARGFVNVYPNAGAFGFPRGVTTHVRGFIGPDDPSIREEAHAFVGRVAEPYPSNLARILCDMWTGHLSSSDAWLMPKSHWHYELHFGNRALLEAVLPSIGVDVEQLRERNDGSAIAFTLSESNLLRDATERLLTALASSDFLIVWPDAATLCTVHHHQQLWWQTSDPAVGAALAAVR